LETCRRCGGQHRVIASIEDPAVIARILEHLALREVRSPPVATVVNDDPDFLGSFHGSDASTLDSTGFYNFSYTIRANYPGTSDFHVSGKVSITCSGLNALP
ncbi:MAG: hypothetical protein ACRETY_07325, partial [Steroidobacteraceae bacterium]